MYQRTSKKLKEYYVDKSKNYLPLIFFLILVSLFAPRGIGVNLIGSVVDISEILIVFLFILCIPFLRSYSVGELSLVASVILPLTFIIFREDSIFSLQRYIFFFFISFSGFFIGKFLMTYSNKDLVPKLVAKLMVVNSVALILYFINDYFLIFDLSSLRAYDPELSDRLASMTRDLGINYFDNFIGYAVVMNSFAIHQSIIFYIGCTFYFLFHKDFSRLLKFLVYLSIIISITSIALSQSRGPLLFSSLLLILFSFWDIFLRKSNRVGIRSNPIFLIILIIFCLIIYYSEQVIFIITNLSTLLNYADVSGLGGISIQDSGSKRIAALSSIPELILVYPHSILIGLGEGFWSYEKIYSFLLFGDLGLLITYLFEFGIISWAILVTFLYINIKNLINRGDFLSLALSIIIVLSLLSLMITSMKDSYWLFFMIVGMISQHNNESLHNNNSIP